MRGGGSISEEVTCEEEQQKPHDSCESWQDKEGSGFEFYLEKESEQAQVAWRRKKLGWYWRDSWRVHREGLYFLDSLTVLVLPSKKMLTAEGHSNTGEKT